MKVIAFAVVDKDYINPLRVALKSFRIKNNIPFKIYKIDNFEIPDDLKNIPNVEYIDFKPEKTIKWVNVNFNKFNRESFEDNIYTDSKIINMFTHLEIEDILLKEYDVVFKTDIDVVYLDNIDNAINNFLESDKSIGMSAERGPVKNYPDIKYLFRDFELYYNAGFLMLNSKKCSNMFDNIVNIIEKYDFKNFKFLDQDALNLYFKNEIYNLLNEGLINTCLYCNGNKNIPNSISAVHYNLIEKPWSNRFRWFFLIAHSSHPYYLKIAEKFKCDDNFLNDIVNNVNNASNSSKNLFSLNRIELFLCKKVIEKMKAFISLLSTLSTI